MLEMDDIDNQDKTPITAKGHLRNRQESYLIFLVLPVLCILLFPLGGLLYLLGRLSFQTFFSVLTIYPATGVFMVYCFVAGVWRLVSGWKRQSQRMKALIAVEIAIPVVFVLLFVLPLSGLCRLPLWPASPHICGFRDRIMSKADIPAIRAWLETLEKDDDGQFSHDLPREGWPKSLKALKAPAVRVWPDQNGNPYVMIIDGGGFHHWGATIGFQDMVIPESDLRSEYDTWLLVEPGVYVFAW